MSLRKHQQEFSQTISRIISGEPIRTIYCPVTPGGGKSILPIIAGKLIHAGRADRLIWITPRLSLIDQAEREFLNPYFRESIGHRLQIRSSTNEPNPCRGFNGFATTFNAVGLDDGILPAEFERSRYILILDEFHHVALGSEWEQKLIPLYERAAFRVLMTGTAERGDGQQIAFMPYRMNGGGLIPDLKDTPDTAVIRYTRADALGERAIIPLSFLLHDGEASWEDRAGRPVTVPSMDRMREQDASKAIYTALKTEYAEHLLQTGIAHWQRHRREIPHAKCLIVCSNIEEAKRHVETLSRMAAGRFAIATSEDTPSALRAIQAIKRDQLDILVAVAMIYEGLSIEAVSHIISLTRIRSTPWIEQMVARANRIDPLAGPYERQIGHIFAPADPLFRGIVDRIEAEQLPEIRRREREQRPGNGGAEQPGLFGPAAPGGITPLSSAMTGRREYVMGPIPEPLPPTSSEIEASLLSQIESHVRTWAFNNRYNPKRLNADIRAWAGKPRSEMTLRELETCLEYVRRTYPVERVRGTGKRAPTKAEPYPCSWMERSGGGS